MSEPVVEELTAAAEIRAALPVVAQLRPAPEAELLALIERMRERGYRLFALREDGSILAVAGLTVRTNLDHGRHVWVSDLVVDEAHRSQGYGGRLLAWVEEWAQTRDCTCVELASGLWRDRAHDFYEREGMERYCYTFRADLPAESPS